MQDVHKLTPASPVRVDWRRARGCRLARGQRSRDHH